MEKQVFEQAATLRQAAGTARGHRKRPTRRRLAERIREERQLLQMIATRAFRRRRPKAVTRVMSGGERVVVRRRARKA